MYVSATTEFYPWRSEIGQNYIEIRMYSESAEKGEEQKK
jgi:hypothetical protein